MDDLGKEGKGRHDLLLQEIEAIDDYWGPTFRAIFDTDECDAFVNKLENRIRTHDRDIEKLCSAHHQGFIESIKDLLELKGLANRIHGEVKSIDDEICRSITNLKVKGQELVDARRVEKNIKTSIELLQQCLPVLRIYIKLQQQMKEKRYYPALKTLEQLEHTHLPTISHYRFSEHLRKNLSKVRESIKDASMSDLKDFLESIRKFSPKIGEVAMRQTANQLNMDSVNTSDSANNPFLLPNISENGFDDHSDMYSVDEDLSAQDLVDFSPVYRCLHIHTVLDAKETYESYYRKQRKKQARLAMQPPTNMHETIESYRQYFNGIVGFFVVEDHVMNTASTLVNRSYLDDVWNIAVSKIASSVRTHSSYCTDPDLMLEIKNLVMLFMSTLRSYGYSVSQLSELLQEIRDHYNEVLMQRWVHVFRDIFDADNYHPILVAAPAEYQREIEEFPYRESSLEAAPFPKRLPYSRMVPLVYRQIQQYIEQCLKFSKDLNVADQEIDDTLRRYTNLLLTRTLSGCLSTLIRRPSLSLLQLIQISINTNYLEESNGWLEEFIATLTGMTREMSHVARLQGRSVFRDVRSDAEQQIYESLKCKMNEFMELANYDWLLNEPSGHASSYLMDLIAFLKSTFQAFTNLKDHVAQNACMTACSHTAHTLMEMLISDDVKSISMGALQQINLDVIQCEQFAASEPVPGLEEGTLLACFFDLRQLLDLLLSWDYSAYFSDYGKTTSKYIRVPPHRAIVILEKLREADKKSSMFSVLTKKSDRDKKKLLETVLKQLKQLQSST